MNVTITPPLAHLVRQEEYIEEGIPWETVEFVDNLETLSLIEVREYRVYQTIGTSHNAARSPRSDGFVGPPSPHSAAR